MLSFALNCRFVKRMSRAETHWENCKIVKLLLCNFKLLFAIERESESAKVVCKSQITQADTDGKWEMNGELEPDLRVTNHELFLACNARKFCHINRETSSIARHARLS